MPHLSKKIPVVLSLGILAGRESEGLSATLESLFRQSVFERLPLRHQQCELIVVAEAGAGRAVAVARDFVAHVEETHRWFDGRNARVIELPEAGRAGAWNRFVHEFSALEAQFLCLLEPGVMFPQRDTIHQLLATLERLPQVRACVGRPRSDLTCKARLSPGERLTLASEAWARGAARRIDRLLYCLRAPVARAVVLPRELEGGEEAFLQEVICTDSLAREASLLRIAPAVEAAYLHRGPRTLRAALAEEARDLARRAVVNAALAHLRTLPPDERVHLDETVRRLDASDPDWVRRSLAMRLREGGLGVAAVARRWRERSGPRARRSWPRRIAGLPVAALAAAGSLLAARRARRALERALAAHFSAGTKTVRPSVPQAAE